MDIVYTWSQCLWVIVWTRVRKKFLISGLVEICQKKGFMNIKT